MRQTLTLALLFAVSLLHAQGLLTATYYGVDVTNSMAGVTGPASIAEMEVDLAITLNGGTNRTVGLRRYETDVVPGTANYFCWAECYIPQPAGAIPVWTAPDSQLLTAGATFNGFHAYYRPNGQPGLSTFRYVWYALDDPTDTVYVDIPFQADVVGVDELDGRDVRFSMLPNPVSGGDVTFTFDAPVAKGGHVVLRNALGALHLSLPVLPGQRSMVVPVDRLGNGIWFASFAQNGREVATRRLVVSGQ